MKRNTSILFKTSALVVTFMLLLGGGIMSLSFLHCGVKPNDGNFLTPEHAIAAPTAQELLQKKFDAYNTVTEEDGKRVVTIFSEEQITDIRTRRENGEWFWLSSEEMLYLINDTVKLFEEYDIVYIRDLAGKLNKYYGLSFFSSEEYYASFGGFDLGVTDASFDLKKDVYETILERARVLNSAVYSTQHLIQNECYVVTDIKTPITVYEANKIKNAINPWYKSEEITNESRFNAWKFLPSEEIFYDANISKEQQNLQFDISVFSTRTFSKEIGMHKYDRQGKTVVIEIYDESTQKLVFRIRINEKENLQETAIIQDRLNKVLENYADNNDTFQITDYCSVVYLNGFETFGTLDTIIIYCPDGDLDLFCFLMHLDSPYLFSRYYFPYGGKPLTEALNEILAEYIE